MRVGNIDPWPMDSSAALTRKMQMASLPSTSGHGRAPTTGFVPQEYLGQLDPADRVERWRRILHTTDWSRGGVMVALAGAHVVGFIAFGPTRDADDNPEQVGQVQSIYLLPDVWGKGLGRQLMAAAIEHLSLAGYAQATLWVLQSNDRARLFYAKNGWAEDGAVQLDDSRGFPLTEVRYRRLLPGTF